MRSHVSFFVDMEIFVNDPAGGDIRDVHHPTGRLDLIYKEAYKRYRQRIPPERRGAGGLTNVAWETWQKKWDERKKRADHHVSAEG